MNEALAVDFAVFVITGGVGVVFGLIVQYAMRTRK